MLVDDAGRYLIRRPILRTDDCGLADRPAPGARHLLPLGVAHVLALPAHVRLVNLDRPVKGRAAARLRHPGFPDAVQHEPRGLLRNLEVPMELHAGNRFQNW